MKVVERRLLYVLQAKALFRLPKVNLTDRFRESRLWGPRGEDSSRDVQSTMHACRAVERDVRGTEVKPTRKSRARDDQQGLCRGGFLASLPSSGVDRAPSFLLTSNTMVSCAGETVPESQTV